MANLDKIREALELLERADALLAEAGIPDDMESSEGVYTAIESVREDLGRLEDGYPS